MFHHEVYISEISTLSLRGILGASGTIGVSLGITLVYVLGSVLSWESVSLVCGLLPLFCSLIFFFFCPESPSWLALNGRKEEARGVLAWLRGMSFHQDEENHLEGTEKEST